MRARLVHGLAAALAVLVVGIGCGGDSPAPPPPPPPAITVTGIAPASGPITGGTAVTITGTGFTGATGATVGGAALTGFTVVSNTSITGTTPAGTAGAQDVAVTDGTNTGTLAGGFTYNGPPTVTAIAPSTGPNTGGTAVTITGTNFVSGATVTVGGASATGVTFVSGTSLTAVTPAGTDGAQDVVVTNPDTQSGTLTGGFTYAPVVTSIAPAAGPTAGGTIVTITGEGFEAGNVSVTLNGVTAAVSVSTATSITATSAAGTAAIGDVVVTNLTSTQAGTLTNGWEYTDTLVVTGIAPNGGPAAGGTAVTITGSGFNIGPATGATIGGAALTAFTVVNDSTITGTTPAGTGVVDVFVTDGTLSDTLAGGFTYQVGPTVTSVAPTSGPEAGGTAITVTGTDFVSGAGLRVLVGATDATGVTFVSATSITAVTPAGTAGPAVGITVVNPDTQQDTLASAYTYVAAPAVTSIAPATGPNTGGTAVTITGTDFVSGATVTIGGAAATSVVFGSATSLTAVTPTGTDGAQDVVVTNPDTQTGTLTGGFTYAPVVTSVLPIAGGVAGGTAVTITGDGFDATPTVDFGANPATAVVRVNATTVTCLSPAGGAGTVAVTVTNPSTQSDTLASAFTYGTPPQVSGTLPADGATFASTVGTLVIRYDATMDANAGTAANYTLTGGATVTGVTTSGTPTEAVLTVTGLAASTAYTLTVSAAITGGADSIALDGNKDGTDGDDFTMSFTTGLGAGTFATKVWTDLGQVDLAAGGNVAEAATFVDSNTHSEIVFGKDAVLAPVTGVGVQFIDSNPDTCDTTIDLAAAGFGPGSVVRFTGTTQNDNRDYRVASLTTTGTANDTFVFQQWDNVSVETAGGVTLDGTDGKVELWRNGANAGAALGTATKVDATATDPTVVGRNGPLFDVTVSNTGANALAVRLADTGSALTWEMRAIVYTAAAGWGTEQTLGTVTQDPDVDLAIAFRGEIPTVAYANSAGDARFAEYIASVWTQQNFYTNPGAFPAVFAFVTFVNADRGLLAYGTPGSVSGMQLHGRAYNAIASPGTPVRPDQLLFDNDDFYRNPNNTAADNDVGFYLDAAGNFMIAFTLNSANNVVVSSRYDAGPADAWGTLKTVATLTNPVWNIAAAPNDLFEGGAGVLFASIDGVWFFVQESADAGGTLAGTLQGVQYAAGTDSWGGSVGFNPPATGPIRNFRQFFETDGDAHLLVLDETSPTDGELYHYFYDASGASWSTAQRVDSTTLTNPVPTNDPRARYQVANALGAGTGNGTISMPAEQETTNETRLTLNRLTAGVPPTFGGAVRAGTGGSGVFENNGESFADLSGDTVSVWNEFGGGPGQGVFARTYFAGFGGLQTVETLQAPAVMPNYVDVSAHHTYAPGVLGGTFMLHAVTFAARPGGVAGQRIMLNRFADR